MATPAGQGYRSPLNLRLEQIPKTANSELFQEFIPIYNAIHTLNAYLDSLRLALEGGDPEKPASEEMRFVRGFWVEAGQDIAQGSVITVKAGKAVLGCGKRRKVAGAVAIVDTYLTGIALTEALSGEKVRLGIGPAILNVPGFKADKEVWATPPGGDFAGQFLAVHVDGALRIGTAVMDDYILITPAFLNI